MSNMFETAIRKKLRFPFKGMISVEDLWDLSVKDLDLIFKKLNAEIKVAAEESLLNTKSKEDEILDLKIQIVRYIVSVKLEEEELRTEARANKEQRQKIMEILSAKKDQSLQNKTVEELQAMLDQLI